MSKHTPGPWHVEFIKEWPFGVRVKSGHVEIFHAHACCHASGQKTRQDCEMGVGFPAHEREEVSEMVARQDADARLIAAAPELLAACESAEKWIDPDQHDSRPGRELRNELLAAIAKAKGDA